MSPIVRVHSERMTGLVGHIRTVPIRRNNPKKVWNEKRFGLLSDIGRTIDWRLKEDADSFEC